MPKKVQKKMQNKRSKKSKKTKSKMMKVSGLSPEALSYAKLISDPCNGPLVRSVGAVHPGAVTERLRKTYSGFLSNAGEIGNLANGYIVWFPSYHNGGADGATAGVANEGGNLFFFTTGNASNKPTNSVTFPAGSPVSAINTGAAFTGLFLDDPCHEQLSSDSVFVRASTLSACLQVDYVSALSSISGQICTVSNYSLSSFVNTAGAAPVTFPSVDEIFSHSAVRQRLHPEGAEVIWRPTDQSVKPRTNATTNLGTTQAGLVADAPFWGGKTAVDYTRVCAPDPNEVFGICIAWKGVPTSSLSFNAVKVVNLELAARKAQIEQVLTGEKQSISSTPISAVTNFMDTAMPGWQTSLVHAGREVAKMALGGFGGVVMDTVSPLLSNVYSGGMPHQARKGFAAIMDR